MRGLRSDHRPAAARRSRRGAARERLLARLIERHAISDDLARKLVAWTHPGFSSDIAEAHRLSRRGRVGAHAHDIGMDYQRWWRPVNSAASATGQWR
jgi:hypothetical protein